CRPVLLRGGSEPRHLRRRRLRPAARAAGVTADPRARRSADGGSGGDPGRRDDRRGAPVLMRQPEHGAPSPGVTPAALRPPAGRYGGAPCVAERPRAARPSLRAAGAAPLSASARAPATTPRQGAAAPAARPRTTRRPPARRAR